METNSTFTKKGLFAVGYVENNATYLEDLKKLLTEDNHSLTFNDLTDIVDKARKEYFNAAGYSKSYDKKAVTKEEARYIRFSLNLKNSEGQELYGWFSRKKMSDNFIGVKWGTEKDFISMIRKNSRFVIGDLSFERFQDGLDFLKDIAESTISESWSYQHQQTKIDHPILKSYLENIIIRLKYEESNGKSDRFVYSRDKKYVMFNTNLLDKFFHDVVIVGKVVEEDGKELIMNPSRATSSKKILDLGFNRETKPQPPIFFDDVNDVIFRPTWKIDDDFDAYNHIVEERIDRFPEKYREETSESLARKLDNAIQYAIAMAQRNYKFIVPMYRPQKDKIQLLMPIYLEGTYSKKPDFALVLTPDDKNKLYLPETILPLDAAYQNARLIAKPDEAWLNPDEL